MNNKDDIKDIRKTKDLQSLSQTLLPLAQNILGKNGFVETDIITNWSEIIGEQLQEMNEPAEDTLTATQVAKTFNMTVWDFNCILRDMGIQYRRGGHWNICDDLADRDLVRLRTHISYSLKGEKKVKVYMTWTMSGLRYLNSKLGYPNF
jgi:hypothetical protein